jgi:amino acid transporter
MTSSRKLSLLTVILININIMIGTGIFINTTELAKRAGILGSLSYALVALLLLPLVISISDLLRMYPGEGFFHFGARSIHPFVGFLSTWSYFFAKLGSVTLGVHIFVSIIQQIIPPLAVIPTLFFDAAIILLLTILNTRNMQVASTLQKGIAFAKAIPILVVIGIGIFLIQSGTWTSPQVTLDSFVSSVPLVLFSLLGFEAVCSLSSRIENPELNGHKAVLISYSIVVIIYMIYQTLFYTVLGQNFLHFVDYKDAFPALLASAFHNQTVQSYSSLIMYLFIAFSALSSAYSILFANQWNLHTLAVEKQFVGHRWFSFLNHANVPVICALTEMVFCLVYLFLTNGQQFVLQQLAAFGSTITYLLSTLSLFVAAPALRIRIIAGLGIGSCSLLLISCVQNFMRNGQTMLLLFCVMLLFGITLYCLELPHFKGNKRT